MRTPAALGRAQQAPVGAGGGQRQSIIRTVPAPVGGWNKRDSEAAMSPVDALVLDNWVPRIADVVLRGGVVNYATGFAARPKTLAVHSGLSNVNKMFAITDAGIFDASAAGAIGGSVLARTSGYHVPVMMGTSAGNYLTLWNGVDKPAFFDGAAWVAVDAASVPAITGVVTTGLVSANVYKRRLFMLERNKLSFWYLPADAIGGAALEFQLGPLCNKGGFTMAMATWSRDGGSGPDDYACFVTSEGEVVVFTGTNPSDVTLWSLVGVYYIGKPIGRRCFVKYGGELLLLTEYGAFPLSKAVGSDSPALTALTNKISGAFIEAARLYAVNQGWGIHILPSQDALLVNIPTTAGGATAMQFVMNTTTKAWCRFTGWNASDFVVFNGELYFADANKVSKAWSGRSDYGVNIVAEAQTAFSNFKDGRTKDWKMFRPFLRVNGGISYSTGMAVDFETPDLLSTVTFTSVSGAVWDVSKWDVDLWAQGLVMVNDWNTPGVKAGVYGSGRLKVATNSLEVHWTANDYLYEMGSVAT